jgi:GT2 family glycosyltransferase
MTRNFIKEIGPEKGSSEKRPHVFAIMPVFNRLGFTLRCIDDLRGQTYRLLSVIVVDGGSTDGTVEALKRDHPDIIVLGGSGELWWTGAMKLGIGHVLSMSRNEEDMILMINNDTMIPPDYVETLVQVSLEEKAAVAGVILDSHDPGRVLDAGEMIDWSTYSFPVRTEVSDLDGFFDGVDVLPGRGSLVPIHMVRAVGNVDAKMFPHYIGDYEFFCRVRRHGFRIGVTSRTHLLAHIKETGIVPGKERVSLFDFLEEKFARKSMANVVDHWRFANLCAPTQFRSRIKWILLKSLFLELMVRTRLAIVMRPIYKCCCYLRHRVLVLIGS